MEMTTRRNFLAVAGAGTAAAGLALGLPAATGTEAVLRLPADAADAIAAVIHDVRKGEVIIAVAEEQVVVTDHDLVARIAAAYSAAR